MNTPEKKAAKCPPEEAKYVTSEKVYKMRCQKYGSFKFCGVTICETKDSWIDDVSPAKWSVLAVPFLAAGPFSR
jgi:hypothetical protein